MWEFTLKKPKHAFISKLFEANIYWGRLVNGTLVKWNRAFYDFDWVTGKQDEWEYVGDIRTFYGTDSDITDPKLTSESSQWESTFRKVKDQNEPLLE